ncbi:YcaQ family DNA glycosylase [Candidatus Acetothermia bacterium]|nr:YcaQ family DNA glycosylase [Candidatus Acetothermia bacterium]
MIKDFDRATALTNSIRTISLTLARRLFIMRQRLAGPRPAANSEGIMHVVRDLGCLQLDPTSIVARNHLLVLWSRLGPYDPTHLDKLLWEERQLFEYWAHAASIVLTEDYPVHQLRMRHYPAGDSTWTERVRTWMDENKSLRDSILKELRHQGPMLAKEFDDNAVRSWQSSGWTSGRNVDRMLAFLWSQGKVMVAGRQGGQKLWDLSERCLPKWTPLEDLSERDVVHRAAQKSLRALGVARAKDIELHYTSGRYPGLASVLNELEDEGRIVRVQIAEDKQLWPGDWYIHAEDVPLLERLDAGEWEPRTTLLSPFDNLISERPRTELLFNFRFRLEIYVPKAKRQYGYFVMPILHGDRLIGRIDPQMDRKQKRLTINAVYAEPNAPMAKQAVQAIAGAIEELGQFLGADEIAYTRRVPAKWKSALR